MIDNMVHMLRTALGVFLIGRDSQKTLVFHIKKKEKHNDGLL